MPTAERFLIGCAAGVLIGETLGLEWMILLIFGIAGWIGAGELGHLMKTQNMVSRKQLESKTQLMLPRPNEDRR